MEDRETPRIHKYGETKNDSNYDGNCTSCDFQFRTYEISGGLIFVEQSVHVTFCANCNQSINQSINQSLSVCLSVYLSIYLSIYLCLSVRPSVLEELTGSQPVKKFPSFYVTRRFITAFTSARHLSISSARAIQSMPPNPTSLRSILILLYHLGPRLGLPSGLLPSGFPTTLYAYPLSRPMRATCRAHHILLGLITVSNAEHKAPPYELP